MTNYQRVRQERARKAREEWQAKKTKLNEWFSEIDAPDWIRKLFDEVVGGPAHQTWI